MLSSHAETGDGAVERRHARLEGSERVGVTRVARVVEVPAYGLPELSHAREEPACLARDGDADRVGEQDLVRPGFDDASSQLDDPSLVDSPFEGTAEGHADRHARANPALTRPLDDSTRRGERLVDRCVLVPPVERLGRAEGEANLTELGVFEALVPTLVECESRVEDSRAAVEARDHHLCSRHLRNASRVD